MCRSGSEAPHAWREEEHSRRGLHGAGRGGPGNGQGLRLDLWGAPRPDPTQALEGLPHVHARPLVQSGGARSCGRCVCPRGGPWGGVSCQPPGCRPTTSAPRRTPAWASPPLGQGSVPADQACSLPGARPKRTQRLSAETWGLLRLPLERVSGAQGGRLGTPGPEGQPPTIRSGARAVGSGGWCSAR